MVMPGRITTLSGGHASPGPQAVPLQDRPVPAIRRLSQGLGPGQRAAADTPNSDLSRPHDTMSRVNNSPRTPPPTAQRFDAFRQQQHHYSASSPYHSSQSQLRPGSGHINSSRPVSAVRPQSAMAVTSPSFQSGAATVVERPPSSLGVAWGSNYRSGTPVLKQNSTEGTDGRTQSSDKNSLENRLKSLVTDGPAGAGRANWNDQHKHQDSVNQFPLHQRSRSYGDGAIPGDTYRDGYGQTGDLQGDDVYARINKRQDTARGFESIPGYVTPSRALESTKSSNIDSQASNSRNNNSVAKESQGGYDLRTAWQRLYGNRPSGGVTTGHSRRQSVEDSIDSSIAGDTNSFIRSPSQRQLQSTQQTSYQLNQNYRQQSPSGGASHAANSQSSLSTENISNAQHAWNSRTGQPTERNDYSNPYLLLPPSTESITGGRESPTGQSSSNPDQVSGSNNSSQLSSISMVSNQFTTFKPEKKKKQTSSVNLSPHREVITPLGPAAKYPEMQHQLRDVFSGPSHNIIGPRSKSPGIQRHPRSSPHQTHRTRPLSSSPHADVSNPRRHRSDSHSSEGTTEFVVRGESKGYSVTRPLSRGKDPTALFNDSDDEDNLAADYQISNMDSVFDYPLDDEDLVHRGAAGSDLDGSVSPPLPPLSSTQEASSHSPSRPYVRGDTTRHKYTTPSSAADILQSERIDPQDLRGSGPANYETGFDARRTKSVRPTYAKETRSHKASLNDYARSRSLEDVRESGNESVISFDVENTMLMVEPSDQSEMGTLRSQTAGSSVRAQLNRLEGMYSQVMRSLEDRQGSSPGGKRGEDGGGRSRARRRWSIGSSDTSSMRRHHHHHHHHQHGHKEHHGSGGSRHSRGAAGADSDGSWIEGKGGRVIGKRFQRLESHVITLARSVAHLSSELRSHNSMSREMENVKREILELKKSRDGSDRYQPQTPGHFMGDNHRLLTEFERYKGWVPSLTNPRRVNKLTKFFGQEPPLLEIFMRRLGYEKYVKNFEDEHIGMIELPYMTEERLKSIGIPMGPRMRILQEAQLCFQQGNFDVYFV